MPDTISQFSEKNNKASTTGLSLPIPPSKMLQTRGQMANSNVYFCASFQIVLAQQDGILCLPGINCNFKLATALPKSNQSHFFSGTLFPKVGMSPAMVMAW